MQNVAFTRILTDGRELIVAIGPDAMPIVTIGGELQSVGEGVGRLYNPIVANGVTYTNYLAHNPYSRKSGMIPITAAECEAYKAIDSRIRLARHDSEQAAIVAAIPGVNELRAAMVAESDYADAFERMMDDEFNDGANPPKRPSVSAAELAAKYPVAALYLKAEGYTYSDNYHKSGAGRRAMEALVAGGSEAEAEGILNNWLPESAEWD